MLNINTLKRSNDKEKYDIGRNNITTLIIYEWIKQVYKLIIRIKLIYYMKKLPLC